MNKIIKGILIFICTCGMVIGLGMCGSDNPDIIEVIKSVIGGLVIFMMSMGGIYLICQSEEENK